MKKKKKTKNTAVSSNKNISLNYRIIHKSSILSGLVRKGGIRFKWAMVISFILIIIVVMFVLLFTVMSSNALMSANDKLCLTIAGNISASESILTAEKKPLKRSMILQDIVSGLAKSNINGLEYAAVYDLSGKLVEREASYAAHTESIKRGRYIPKKIYNEIKDINTFKKNTIVIYDKNNNQIRAIQYRLPFYFFNVKVGVVEIVFSEDSILGPVKKARIIIIIFSCILLALGIVISIVVAKSMVRPIRELSDGMGEVRTGNLDINLEIQRHDELGDLSLEFNNMIVHLREKLHMQKFVSKSTVSMIKEKTAAGSLNLGGKRQNHAFLFSDVRGFTAMSEKMEPEEVVQILNKYLDLQAQIIKKNHGDIDKFVGDEVMAVFSGDKKADNAILCSIEIIDEINKLNTQRANKGEKTVQVGIGLNLGYVIEGRIGSSDRMDFTSIGDTVNLAARLCSQAEPGTILASKELMSKSSKGKFKGKKLDPIKVKGKEKPVEIYLITGNK